MSQQTALNVRRMLALVIASAVVAVTVGVAAPGWAAPTVPAPTLADPANPDVDASTLVAIPVIGGTSQEAVQVVLAADNQAQVDLPTDDGGPIAIHTSQSRAPGLAGELMASGLFEAVDYDMQRYPSDADYTATPNDPMFNNTYGWGLKEAPGSNLSSLWPTLSSARPGSAAPIAVIDSGFVAAHDDLGSWVVPKWDYGDDDADVVPTGPNANFHGTQVASIIGAIPNNALGVAGAGWDTPVWCYKVADESGIVRDSAISQAIDAAVRDGAKVINISMGGAGMSQAMKAAVERAHSQGVVVVAAAGQTNDTDPTDSQLGQMHYPASFPTVVSVAGLRPDGSVLPNGYHNTLVDLAGPASKVGILVDGNGEAYGVGTSFAAPHVAATAALLFRHRPDLSPDAVIEAIVSTARDVASTGAGVDPYTGAGSLDAAAALRKATATVGPASRLSVTPSAQATLADRPISVALAAWDLADNPVPTTKATVTFSLGTGCTFAVGTSPAVRTCTITARQDGAQAQATVAVFDISALRRVSISGNPVPGGVLALAAPSGWPADAITWQWTQAGAAVPGAIGTSYTLPANAAPGLLIGVIWTLQHRGLTTSGHIDAQAVVRDPNAQGGGDSPGGGQPGDVKDPGVSSPPGRDRSKGVTNPPDTNQPGATPTAKKATAKVTLARKGRSVIVRVKVAGISKPTGKLRVKFGKTTVRATMKASAKGVVKVTVPKKIRGKVKVTAVLDATTKIAKAVSKTKRLTFV
ncbi:MAG: S8 family serine peptidase [Bifidobacteriaceae bacterium]|jgi:hypothetical protein|nr:S8 family serine peptidase [Bifidobacteriaceae bacterium]